MSHAVDRLSASASAPARGHRTSRSLNSAMSPTVGQVVFSPGGTLGSYGSTQSHRETKNAPLKQAKGTGRTIGQAPNQKSFHELQETVENTPGAEIRM